MLLVHEGLPWKEAAERAEYTPSAMIYALSQSHVKAFIREQKDVLRTGMSGRNILAACEVRDQTDNQTARIAAIRWLEGEQDQSVAASSKAQAAGVTIVIQTTPAVGNAVGQQGATIDLQAISTDPEG